MTSSIMFAALDPFATGLLVLLIGKEYTRRAGEFSRLDKTYQVTLKLGATSTTGDPEGQIEAVSDTIPDIKDIEKVISEFRGEIMQIPPAYSAIKIDGQRAYKLARAGKEVIIKARPATIHHLEIVDYTYPEIQLVAEVSSGTYIRTLVGDLGKALGIGAYTTNLRRTIIGDFTVDDSIKIQDITAEALLYVIKKEHTIKRK